MYLLLLKLKKSFHFFFYLIAIITIGELLYLTLKDTIRDTINISNLINSNTAYTFENEELSTATPKELGAGGDAQSMNINLGRVNASTKSYDFRAHIFDSYFRANNSPLTGYGQNFVDACEANHAPDDCLLMVAIAKAETDLCKTGISDAQKNCWGFGGSGENRIVWPNYETSISEVTRRVMVGYGTRFFEDANAGALYYCGAHCDKWGDIINSYKQEINRFGIGLGYTSLL